MSATGRDQQPWQCERQRLGEWLVARGGVIRSEWPVGPFGNRLVEAEVDGWSVRLVLDRGDILIDVGTPGHWHALRSLVAFAAGLAPGLAIDLADGGVTALRDGWPAITAALADPGLADFEERVGTAAIGKLLGARAPHGVAAA